MSISDSPKIYYRDEYLIEEDEVGSSGAQDLMIRYLIEVLVWYYRSEMWHIAREMHFYHPAIDNPHNLIIPDIAVFKGIPFAAHEPFPPKSWDMRQGDKPCPPVMIEASSDDTWKRDIEPDKKPMLYGLMGVKEYFAYDPNVVPLYPRRINRRLLGWRYDASGIAIPIEPDATGRLWSEQLESWLVADGIYLRLYDRDGNQRLTGQAIGELAEAAQRRAEVEAKARQKAERRAEAKALEAAEKTRQAQIEATARLEAQRLAEQEATARQEAEKREKAAQRREKAARQQAERQAELNQREIAELRRQMEELRNKQPE